MTSLVQCRSRTKRRNIKRCVCFDAVATPDHEQSVHTIMGCLSPRFSSLANDASRNRLEHAYPVDARHEVVMLVMETTKQLAC